MITKFVTSLSLHRTERQRFCLTSWRRYGFPVVAVQCESQVDELRAIYGNLIDDFVVLPERPNAWGKPYLARVADHIKQTADGTILLINSDIEIRDTLERFFAQWCGDDADTLICGVRLDHPFGNYRSKMHPYGIDAFRITPEMAAALPDDGFVIGSPGWDYWLPWRASQAGYKVRAAKSQLMHEVHEMGYGRDAVDVAHSIMLGQFNVPPHLLTLWIQWATDRVDMRFEKPKKQSKKRGR